MSRLVRFLAIATLVGACQSVSPSPRPTDRVTIAPAPSVGVLTVKCDGVPADWISCHDLADETIARLPNPHGAVLALRFVGTVPPLNAHPVFGSPFLVVGVTFSDRPHVEAFRVMLDGGRVADVTAQL